MHTAAGRNSQALEICALANRVNFCKYLPSFATNNIQDVQKKTTLSNKGHSTNFVPNRIKIMLKKGKTRANWRVGKCRVCKFQRDSSGQHFAFSDSLAGPDLPCFA